MENDLRVKIAEWLEFDKNPTTRKELNALIITNNLDELRKRLCSRMAFGTTGMRAPMEMGNSRMNDLTIIQTTQGMAVHLKKTLGDKVTGVVVGYDIRHNSERFARLAANVFIASGITVHLYREHVPTPLVPYTISALHCQAGVMVTASHNPAADNGYKAYWANGAQILQPVDAAIEAEILRNLRPLDGVFDAEKCLSSDMCHDPRKQPDGRDILELYQETKGESVVAARLRRMMHAPGGTYGEWNGRRLMDNRREDEDTNEPEPVAHGGGAFDPKRVDEFLKLRAEKTLHSTKGWPLWEIKAYAISVGIPPLWDDKRKDKKEHICNVYIY